MPVSFPPAIGRVLVQFSSVQFKLSPITDAAINKAAGAIQSLKTGGRVKGAKKGAPKIIKAHVGEYILPVGVKPTKTQKMAVAKRKAKK